MTTSTRTPAEGRQFLLDNLDEHCKLFERNKDTPKLKALAIELIEIVRSCDERFDIEPWIAKRHLKAMGYDLSVVVDAV